MRDLLSDSLTSNRGEVALGSFRAEYYFKHHGGSPEGGDRFAACLRGGSHLWFYMADASGHGSRGGRFWRECRDRFDNHWQALAASSPSQEGLERFAAGVNGDLAARSDLPAPHLCLTVGALHTAGQLTIGTFGYGAHALVVTAEGVWRAAPERAFGLKLGWVSSERWQQIPGSCMIHRVENVKRLMLLTDGFLGDDYADVESTLRLVDDLGIACSSLPRAEVVRFFERLPHDQDDASLMVVEIQ